MLRGLIALFVFQGIGESIVYFGHLPIPGSIIGMMLLFLTLKTRGRNIPIALEKTSHLMIRYLYLFLIPACTGYFFLAQSNFNEWIFMTFSIFTSTLLTIILGALLMNYMLARYKKKPEVHPQ